MCKVLEKIKKTIRDKDNIRIKTRYIKQIKMKKEKQVASIEKRFLEKFPISGATGSISIQFMKDEKKKFLKKKEKLKQKSKEVIKELDKEIKRLRKCRIGQIGDKHIQVNINECNKLKKLKERLEKLK